MKRYTPLNKEEWLNWRSQGIGASDSAALLGLSPYETPLDLYEKIVFGKKVFETTAMRAGKEMEFIIFPYLQEKIGFALEEQVCASNSKFPFLQCTFDGINESQKTIVEIKYVSNKKRFEEITKSNQIPLHHQVQMQQQMLIAEVENGIYAYVHEFSDEDRDLRLIPLKADPIMQSKLIEAAAKFWCTYIIPRVPPPKTSVYKKKEGSEEKVEEIKEITARPFISKCAKLKKCKCKIQKLLQEEEILKKTLRSMSNESFRCNGVKFQIIESSERISYKDLFKDLEKMPEMAYIFNKIDLKNYAKPIESNVRISLY